MNAHILIVEAPFYEDISGHLITGAARLLEAAGASYERTGVPGALEIPGIISMAMRAGRDGALARPYDGYIALGCVVRGETAHYDIVAGESARGLMDLTVHFGLAVGNGILTTDTREQALVRADPGGKDKGGDAARACLIMIEHRRRFQVGTP